MDRGRPLKKRLGAPSSASSALYPPSWSRALNQGTASAPIRVALLAADPAMPHGQLWDLRHVFRSEQPNPLLQTHVERELPHAAAVEWMESYDALCASVELHTSCVRLVRVFASWAPLREALVSSLAPSFNVLWAGSWLFLALGVYEESEPDNLRAVMEDAIEVMRARTAFHGITVFPPLDYVLFFAQKSGYLERLTKISLPPHLHVPPLLPVDPTRRSMREDAAAFCRMWGVFRAVLKRNVSGRGNHVFAAHPSKLPAIPQDSIEWFLQPYQEAFDRTMEFRMYVVFGHCKWGVATRKNDDKETPCLAVAPGTDLWENQGGMLAASAAEAVASCLAASLEHPPWLCDERGRVWFLRVDMVALDRNCSSWLLNELEFFGNADIHLECMTGAEDLFDELRCMTQCFLGTTVALATGQRVQEELTLAHCESQRRDMQDGNSDLTLLPLPPPRPLLQQRGRMRTAPEPVKEDSIEEVAVELASSSEEHGPDQEVVVVVEEAKEEPFDVDAGQAEVVVVENEQEDHEQAAPVAPPPPTATTDERRLSVRTSSRLRGTTPQLPSHKEPRKFFLDPDPPRIKKKSKTKNTANEAVQ